MSFTKIFGSSTWVLNESIFKFCQLEVADNNFGVLQTIKVHQVLKLYEQKEILRCHSYVSVMPVVKCHYFSLGVSTVIYLKISVDNFLRVEVSYSFQHLPHNIAGVPLRVVSLIQDPVKHLSACSAEEMEHPNWMLLMTRMQKNAKNCLIRVDEVQCTSVSASIFSQVPPIILTTPERGSTLS